MLSSLVNLLLLPVYTTFLSATDYGHLALLLLFGTAAKILFRLGLDAGFFRVHYDLAGEEERRRLAGSVSLLAAGTGGLFLAAVALCAPGLTRLLLGPQAPSSWVVLAAADVYLGSFAFVPLSLLRIQERPGRFSALAGGRHALNAALKVALLVSGLGVTGVLWSDLLATGAFALALAPLVARHAAWSFSPRLLREALAFGLPKVPHGLLVQTLNLADRKILDLFVSRAEVGLYQMGYTLGAAVKFPLSAFEPAWQPFVYGQVGRPQAADTLGRVATYAFTAFLAVGLGVAVLGPELLALLTPHNPAFRAAAPVIPVVALAYLLHAAFLLTSIGIGVRKQAGYYPLVTSAAATVNIGANFLLIPRWGMMGAAWATVLAYAVMAALGFVLSHRLYPVGYQWGRLGRAVGSAAAVFLLSRLAPPALLPALAVKLVLLAGFPFLLALAGFLSPREREAVRRALGRDPTQAGSGPAERGV